MIGTLPKGTVKARRLASELHRLGYSWPEALAIAGPRVGTRTFRAARTWVGGRGRVHALRRDAARRVASFREWANLVLGMEIPHDEDGGSP